MINIKNVSKAFEGITAIKDISMDIKEGEIFGLVGTNGSGKSTLLRMIAGVLKPDNGEVLYDGKSVYENTEVKSNICFLADTGYMPGSATPDDLAKTYKIFYPDFDKGRFTDYLGKIGLDGKRKIRTFSKGMKKQVSVILGICSNTKVLLCDETFDGLDPVMRQTVKSIFATEMLDRKFTPVIASHNLRELEDICDNIGFLHDGKVIYSSSLEQLRLGIQKVQCVIEDAGKEKQLLGRLKVIKSKRNGSMLTIVVRGERQEILNIVNEYSPAFAEAMPLSLEEIFIDEMEVSGYDFKDIFS